MFLIYLCPITSSAMYQTLLILHSLTRWLVLASLVYTIIISWKGYQTNRAFSGRDNTARHVTATIAHIQLLLGLYLYMISPIVKLAPVEGSGIAGEPLFFRLVHIALMVVAIVIITIGSARARRTGTDKSKYRTMLVWFSIALLIILIAIPWPFSPLAQRPYFRSF